MSGSLRNRLLRYEVPPPPGAWEEIQSVLDHSNKGREKDRTVPFMLKRLAAAAVALAAVAITVFYMISPGTKETREIAGIVKNNLHLEPENILLTVPSPAAALGGKILKVPVRKINRPLKAGKSSLISEETTTTSESEGTISENYFADIKPVDMEQPVSIPARLIRDANGNVIMDLNLITTPDAPYITVTGPNGSQTRISSKFLGFLRYLNGDAQDDAANYDEIIWKEKFNSWREKLLNENSFIPAANNFFDIFEMKDIIQE